MSRGQYPHRVTVEEGSEVLDETTGGRDPLWTEIGWFMARIMPIRGREATYAGEQLLAEMDTRIETPWSGLAEALSAKHRLVHQGTLFNVVSAAHVKLEQREVEIMCKSGVNDG